jgi:hypothetical protein
VDFRGNLGKVHRKGHDLAMQLLARELPNRPAQSNFANELDDPDASSTAAPSSRTHDELSPTNASCEYYNFFD